MNWSYSIIHFSTIIVVLAFFWGCAPGPEKTGQASPSGKPLEEQSEPQTKVKISYGNKSSQMSMVLDINSQDVNIKMSGGRQEFKAKEFPWLDKKPKSKEESELPLEPAQQKAREAKGKKEKRSQDDEWDDVMDIAKNSSQTNVQQVLAEIRKAQEFFYQKKYPEALDMTKFSLQKHETAEGYALMGSILYMMGDKQAAKESWLQSLRLNPDMPAVSNMLENIKAGN
ncbi:hypothetical protein ACFL5V_05835 [Fibrobacterota bacterium]